MSWTVYIAWLVWVPLVLALFVLTKPRRAALIAIISGFLFLPNVGYPITGFKTKLSITCLVIVLASLIFAPGSFARLRPKLADLPILAWCLWPFVADRANAFEYYQSSAPIFDAFLPTASPDLLATLCFPHL